MSTNEKKAWQHKKKDGDLIYMEINGHMFDFNSRKSQLLMMVDVTEKLKAEEELRMSESMLAEAQHIAKIGSWNYDFKTDRLKWSEELYAVFGTDKNHFLETHKSFVDFIDPEYRELVATASKNTQKTGDPFNIIYKITTTRGEKRIIEEYGYSEKDNKDNVVRLFGTAQDITERKEAEIKIVEANERFEYVTKATSDVIWDWDLEKNEVYYSDNIQKLFGHNPGVNNNNLPFYFEHVHPDDRERVVLYPNEVKNGTMINWEQQYRFRKADGDYAFIMDTGIVIRDSNGLGKRMVGAMRDITNRKGQEHHLKLLESAINNANDTIIITEASPLDEPGPIIIYVNESFTRMTGYTANEVIGKNPRMFQGSNSDKFALKNLSEALHRFEPFEITTINYKKNGEEFYNNISVNPVMDDKGTVTHFVSVQRDVTHQIKEEKRLQKFTIDLYKQNKELQQFGYVVSHNLRAPVANIMGIVSLLEMDYEDLETVQKCVSDLKKSVNRLDNVIRDLSKILSNTDGSVELTKDSLDLTELITSVKNDLGDLFLKTATNIKLPLESHIIYSHKAYLYSIFYNLISNAIKYRSKEKPSIKIDVKTQDDILIITVSDNGVGIDLERNQDDLFKPYKRFTSTVEGKGLGLFLVKSHVEALKGKIYVESEVGIGTTFTITLPVKTVY
jgi:PAS domain S-box-containing protein